MHTAQSFATGEAAGSLQEALLVIDQGASQPCISTAGIQCWRSEALYMVGRYQDACLAADECVRSTGPAAADVLAHAHLVRGCSLAVLGSTEASRDALQASYEVRRLYCSIGLYRSATRISKRHSRSTWSVHLMIATPVVMPPLLLQAVRTTQSEDSTAFAQHMSRLGEHLGFRNSFATATALLEHALTSVTAPLTGDSTDVARLLASSQQHRLLGQHRLRMQEVHVAEGHASDALHAALAACKCQGSELNPAHPWDSSLLQPMQQPSALASQLKAMPEGPHLTGLVARSTATTAAEALVLLSCVTAARDCSGAVMHALNAVTCARFAAAGGKDALVVRAQAQLCSCTVVGLATRLQAPREPNQAPGSEPQRRAQKEHCAEDQPGARRAAWATPGLPAQRHVSAALQPDMVVPQLAAEHTSDQSGAVHSPAGMAPHGHSATPTSMASWCSVDSAAGGEIEADTMDAPPRDARTDTGLQACAERLAKCSSWLRKQGADLHEPLLSSMVDEAHLASCRVRAHVGLHLHTLRCVLELQPPCCRQLQGQSN